MKKPIIAIVLLLIAFKLISQETEGMLPKWHTEKELKNLENYVRPQPKAITSPPISPVRNVAEWEEMEGIAISWKSGYEYFLREIIRYSSDDGKIFVYCSDSTVVKTYLDNNQISTNNLVYIHNSLNSVWIRDFGPNNIYTNDVDSLLFVDWVYNRNRPLDDASPSLLASLLNVPLYGTTAAPTDLVHTGGNFMSDGFGTGFSSKLVLDENANVSAYNSTPKTRQNVEKIMSDFMGINRYIIMEHLPYDGISHIDMHMKLLDEETLLVGEFPVGISDGPQIEANIQYIQNNYQSVFGTPYKIVRIPMPSSAGGGYPGQPFGNAYYRTYTNAVFVNKTLLVPIYNFDLDTTGLRILREALPAGYNVVGINASNIISQSGAIHCTTHEIAVKDPLLISHQKLRDTDNIFEDYEVNALIQHRSGISNAYIHYRTDLLQPYQTATMTLTDVSNNTWTGYIPVQNSGETVYYYIEANAISGKSQVRPLTAPEGYWSFNVFNITGSIVLNNLNFSSHTFRIDDNVQQLVITSDYEINASISIKNLLGQNVKKIYSGYWPKGKNYINFTTDDMKGIYFIHIKSNRGNFTHKIFIN